MLSRGEIKRALSASWRLARGDAGGHQLFDHSMEGFWRSFGAIVLIAPVYLLTIRAEVVMAEAAGRAMAEDGLEFYVLRLVVLAIEWIAYPIAMVPIAYVLGLGARYAPYIIAYNWTSVLVAAALLPPGLMFASGVIPAGFAQLLFLVALIWAFYFRYSVARSALETNAATAIGLVIVDFLLGLLINLVATDLGM